MAELSSLSMYTIPSALLLVCYQAFVRSVGHATSFLPHTRHGVHALSPSMHYTTPESFLVAVDSPDCETTCRVHQVGLNSVCSTPFCTSPVEYQGLLMSMLTCSSEVSGRYHVTFCTVGHLVFSLDTQHAS